MAATAHQLRHQDPEWFQGRLAGQVLWLSSYLKTKNCSSGRSGHQPSLVQGLRPLWQATVLILPSKKSSLKCLPPTCCLSPLTPAVPPQSPRSSPAVPRPRNAPLWQATVLILPSNVSSQQISPPLSCKGRLCACPRTPNQPTSRYSQAFCMPRDSPRARDHFQPPPAYTPRPTVHTSNLECTQTNLSFPVVTLDLWLPLSKLKPSSSVA